MNVLRTTPLTQWTAGAAALVLLAACGTGDGTPSALGSDAADLHLVERGPMRISVREAAELKASRETLIKSQVEGQATIIYLVPEGSVVEEGERVVELDVSEVEEKRANQGITVERAYATLVNARQNMEILEKEIQAEEEAAKSTLEIAQIDLEKFLGKPKAGGIGDGDTIPEVDVVAEAAAGEPEGQVAGQGMNRDVLSALRELVTEIAEERPQYGGLPEKFVSLLGDTKEEQEAVLERDMGELGQQVLEQIVEIRNARQQLKLDEDQLFHSRNLAQKEYITRNELASDQLRYDTQSSRVELAWQRLDILVSYSLRKEQIDLDLKYSNAVIGLEKTRASSAARRAKEGAELSSREAEYDLAKERLENFDEQIENAVIRAPTPGLVVYAEMDGRGREMIQEGSSVRDRQTLIKLPDVTKMTAEMKIQEADIDKIRVGQPASIQVDAFPDKVLTGTVTRVSPVADSSSRWSNNNLKVYKTWVELDGENGEGELRPNMSATVEILVGEVPDTITVPVSAVRRQGAVKYVWKATPSGPQTVEVNIGRNTLTHVEILDGVREGEQVYLAPPPGVLAPQFEQPQAIEQIPELTRGAEDESTSAGNRDVPTGPGEPRAPRGMGTQPGGELSAAMQEYQDAIIQKFPQFKELIETEGFRALMRNAELREAISNDAELQEMRQQLFPRGGGRRGGGENGGFGGRRGGGNGEGGGFGGRRTDGGNGERRGN